MKNADLALYHAKEQGRGRYAFFTDDLLQKKQDIILDGIIK